MKSKRLSLVACVFVAGSVLAACGSDSTGSGPADSGPAVSTQSSAPAGGGLKVVAAFGPLSELVSRIGDPFVTVANLTGTGIEPHDLELTAEQIDQVLDADLVVFIGAAFQPSLIKALKGRTKPSTDVLSAIKTLKSEEFQVDPHFWLDPLRFRQAATAVSEELAVLDPQHKDAYQANAQTFSTEMADLDKEFATKLKTCERREIVTAHSAFAYLSDRYKLEQIPVAGISPEAEPDAQRMAEIADLIVKRGVTTLFTEELVSPKVAEALAREANVRTEVLSPIEGFTPDEVRAGVEYADKMRFNLDTLVGALGCT